MKHPEREEWVPFLFGEATPEARRELVAHLQSCPECADEIKNWQRSLGRLDRWKLQPTPLRPAQTFAPMLRWAAAAIVLLAAVALGRVTAGSGVDADSLRAEVVAAVEAAQSRQTGSISDLELRLTKVSEMQSRQLLRGFTEVLEHTREQDREAMLAALDRMERDHVADYVALRSDLETVASAADEELQNARRKIGQLAINDARVTPE